MYLSACFITGNNLCKGFHDIWIMGLQLQSSEDFNFSPYQSNKISTSDEAPIEIYQFSKKAFIVENNYSTHKICHISSGSFI
jgi:hypothetical protein